MNEEGRYREIFIPDSFDKSRIELDLLPENVDSLEKATAVFNLMKAIAHLLKMEVILVQEHGGATQEELRQMALCSCDPATAEIRILQDFSPE